MNGLSTTGPGNFDLPPLKIGLIQRLSNLGGSRGKFPILE